MTCRSRVLAFSASLFLAACSGSNSHIEPVNVRGQVARGKILVSSYGCESCHVIPNVEGVRGYIGPSLEHIATKYYLAGQIPNSRENLRLWVQHPHSINPQTLMPEMHITDSDATDISLFLETLK